MTTATRLVIDGDSQTAVRALDDVATAAKDAADEVEELSELDVSVDESPALKALDRISDEADALEAELESLDDVKIDPQVDTSGIQRADADVAQLGDTAQQAGPAIRGVTDELGESAGAAGVFGQAALDAGDAARIMGEKAGLSAQTMDRIGRAAATGAVAVAGAAYLWSEFSKAAERAAEAVRETETAIEELGGGDFDSAAENLRSGFETFIELTEDLGLSADEAFQVLTSGSENYYATLEELQAAYGELGPLQQTVLSEAITRWDEVGVSVLDARTQQEQWSDALRDSGIEIDGVTDKVGDLGDEADYVFGRQVPAALDIAETALDDWRNKLDIEDAGDRMLTKLGEVRDGAVEEFGAAETRDPRLAGETRRRPIRTVESDRSRVRARRHRRSATAAVRDHAATRETVVTIREVRVGSTRTASAAPSTKVPEAEGFRSQGSPMNITVNATAAQSAADLTAELDRWRRINGG